MSNSSCVHKIEEKYLNSMNTFFPEYKKKIMNTIIEKILGIFVMNNYIKKLSPHLRCFCFLSVLL